MLIDVTFLQMMATDVQAMIGGLATKRCARRQTLYHAQQAVLQTDTIGVWW